jgi:signal transduction histidine kinase
MKRVPREFGYLAVTLPLAIPAFVLALLGVVFSVLSLFTIGLPFLVGVLWTARALGGAFRATGRALLGWDLPAPDRRTGRGALEWGRAVLGDGQAWRSLGYCFLKLPLTAAALYAAGMLAVGGLYALTCPAWWWLIPTWRDALDIGPWSRSWYVAAAGAAALLLFPWLVRGAVALDRLLAGALLAPSPATQRIARLESARAVLAADAAATLRRVERDLHDGTQARLVSLGVTLSRIRHRLDREPVDLTEVGGLVDAARGTVADGLAELRDIVRGIHPPALDDGLATALTTLASRSGLPAEVTVALHEPPPDPVATTVYFTAAELLSNAARHAGATRVQVELSEDGDTLRLAVTDDGRGGAAPHAIGTGLAGLARRAEALDGYLDVVSPPGGPTTVTLTLPKG